MHVHICRHQQAISIIQVMLSKLRVANFNGSVCTRTLFTWPPSLWAQWVSYLWVCLVEKGGSIHDFLLWSTTPPNTCLILFVGGDGFVGWWGTQLVVHHQSTLLHHCSAFQPRYTCMCMVHALRIHIAESPLHFLLYIQYTYVCYGHVRKVVLLSFTDHEGNCRLLKHLIAPVT